MIVLVPASAGLTTAAAPFIPDAQARGELYITQPYALYSEANHDTWRRLYAQMTPRWERYATGTFLDGLRALSLDPNRVPRLEDVNQFMTPRTGLRARPVSGYVPAFRFFDSLRNREFPTTITIRDGAVLDYLPEPDIFHDIGGHVPMHTDSAFAEALVSFGECAHVAAEIVQGIGDEGEQLRVLSSIQRAMARFFWFTISINHCSSSFGTSGASSMRCGDWWSGCGVADSTTSRSARPRSARRTCAASWRLDTDGDPDTA